MKQKYFNVSVDGTEYESVSKAALAHGVTPQTVARRIRRFGRTKLTRAELLDSTVVGNKPSMSWDFVYSQITSSPKKRGVHSQPVAHQPA